MDLMVASEDEIVDRILNAGKRQLMLLLGAGTSISSGVPAAGTMMREWRQVLYQRSVAGGKAKLAGLDRDAAAAVVADWFKNHPDYRKIDEDAEYSTLFELYDPAPRVRQQYIDSKIKGSFPSWGYLYLASLMHDGYFNIVLTTNFDDLVSDAMAIYLSQNVVVCAADSEVATITLTSDRPKIIKLHGDYLFERLKNSPEELQSLDPNMTAKFKEFARECGLVVIGYGGRDRSVMDVVEALLHDDRMLPNGGVFWGIRPEPDGTYQPARRVRELAAGYPTRFRLFECSDFDLFMVRLHTAKGLALPDTVSRPFEALKGSFKRLVDHASANQLQDQTIKEHIALLGRELDRPWAQASDPGAFDVLQAQMALGRRDYAKAIEVLSRVAQEAKDRAGALSLWGDALALQGDVEQSQAASDLAIAKWQEAIRLDPDALPARYSLARHYIQRQKQQLALPICEELVKRAPDDRWLRRQLAVLYSGAGRPTDAQREIEWLIARETGSAELFWMKASVLAQRGLTADALDAIERAVALDEANPFLRITLANQLATMGQLDRAGQEFERAIQLDPKNLNFRLQAAQFYWMKQQPLQAKAHLEAAALLEPGSAEVRGWLGQIYLPLGMFIEAQRELEEARRLSPNDARLLINLGMVYAQLNRPDLAEGAWRQAATINQSLPQPHVSLAMLYFMQGRMAELEGEMRALAQIAPPMAQQLGMQLQAMRGQPPNAMAAMQAQWAAMLQGGQSQHQGGPWQNQPGPASSPAPSFTDYIRAAINKLNH